MAYNKTIWKSKDIITREKMQKIEDQLEVLSEQETPTIEGYAKLEDLPTNNSTLLNDLNFINASFNNNGGLIIRIPEGGAND